MTLQASLVDIDILIAAGGAVADRLAALGQLDPRVVTPSQLGRLQAASGLGARLVGAAPGQLFLLTDDEAGAALGGAGADGGLEPALADVVATLKMQVGDVHPEDVRPLSADDQPVLDESTVAVGIFVQDRIVAAIVFTGGDVAGSGPAAPPGRGRRSRRGPGVRAAGLQRAGPRRRPPDEPAARRR